MDASRAATGIEEVLQMINRAFHQRAACLRVREFWKFGNGFHDLAAGMVAPGQVERLCCNFTGEDRVMVKSGFTQTAVANKLTMK
jgi:hypothetical protein